MSVNELGEFGGSDVAGGGKSLKSLFSFPLHAREEANALVTGLLTML